MDGGLENFCNFVVVVSVAELFEDLLHSLKNMITLVLYK